MNTAPDSIAKPSRLGILSVIYSVAIITVLGLTTIPPVLPMISDSLGVSPDKIGLLMAVFTLPGIILTPLAGILADRFGRKRILGPSLILFGVTGYFCSLAPDFTTLLMLRFLEGVGAASLGALNIVLIGDNFEGERRTAVTGYNAAVLSIGTAIFPIIGGQIGKADWHYVFWLPPMAAIVGIFVLMYPEKMSGTKSGSIANYFGSAFKAISNKRMITLLAATFASYVVLFGVFLTYLPYLVRSVKPDADPGLIGMIISSMSIVTAIWTPFSAKLARKFSLESLLKTAYLLFAIGLIWLALSDSIAMIIPAVIIYGTAQSFFLPISQTLLTNMTTVENRAGILSLNRMIVQIGQTAGAGLTGLIYARGSLGAVFGFGAAFAAVAFLFLLVSLKRKV